MIHQPMGGAQGQAKEVEIEAREILRLKSIANEIIANHTGRSVEMVQQDTDRNYYMSAEEAVAYGLIDDVLRSSRAPEA
jgi:ATP-dependent Clp protease protease subunit